MPVSACWCYSDCHHILVPRYLSFISIQSLIVCSLYLSYIWCCSDCCHFLVPRHHSYMNLMFIGPCIIEIVEEWKTNLMSLAILFHFLCAQHVSDINIYIIRSLRLCCWITTSVVLFSARCVLEIWCGWFWAVPMLHASACNTGTACGNSTTQSQTTDDGYINVRSMLST